MIVFLSVMSLRRFERFEETIKELPQIEIPEVAVPELDLDLDELNLRDLNLEDWERDWREGPITEQSGENYKTFVSPDKTLKIKYPANWQEIDKAFLEKINQQMKDFALEEFQILLFAYHQIRLVEYPPVLTVLSLPPKKGLIEVFKEMERIAEEQQIKMEVIKTEIKNGMNYFEAKYKKENYSFYLKGKMVSAKEKNYLITVLALDEFQKESTQQIDFIFNSIQVVQ